MLVSSGPLPADSDRYAFEVKWDGYRALIDASSDGVIVMSRNGLVFTSRYPELQGLAEAVSQPVLLDGETVALDRDGSPTSPRCGSQPGAHRKAPFASWPSTSCG
jgi:bifunctional non-homologous end joining protein LigD